MCSPTGHQRLRSTASGRHRLPHHRAVPRLPVPHRGPTSVGSVCDHVTGYRILVVLGRPTRRSVVLLEPRCGESCTAAWFGGGLVVRAQPLRHDRSTAPYSSADEHSRNRSRSTPSGGLLQRNGSRPAANHDPRRHHRTSRRFVRCPITERVGHLRSHRSTGIGCRYVAGGRPARCLSIHRSRGVRTGIDWKELDTGGRGGRRPGGPGRGRPGRCRPGRCRHDHHHRGGRPRSHRRQGRQGRLQRSWLRERSCDGHERPGRSRRHRQGSRLTTRRRHDVGTGGSLGRCSNPLPRSQAPIGAGLRCRRARGSPGTFIPGPGGSGRCPWRPQRVGRRTRCCSH